MKKKLPKQKLQQIRYHGNRACPNYYFFAKNIICNKFRENSSSFVTTA